MVVDVVVAIRAGQTHLVDIGESTVLPRHDVVNLAAFGVCGAAGAVTVACDDGFDLCLGGESAIAAYPQGLALFVEDQPRYRRHAHHAFQHRLRQCLTPDDLCHTSRFVCSQAFDINDRGELRPRTPRTTAGRVSEASLIVEEVVRCRLAAAGQSWPAKSTHWWDGQVVKRDEFVLVLKTVDNRVDEIMRVIRSLHSYEVPSIAVIAVERLGPGVGDWLRQETHVQAQTHDEPPVPELV